jgi:hypothetical protein
MPFIHKKRMTHNEKRYNIISDEVQTEFDHTHPVRALLETAKRMYAEARMMDDSQRSRVELFFSRIQSHWTEWKRLAYLNEVDRTDPWGNMVWQLNEAQQASARLLASEMQRIADDAIRVMKEENMAHAEEQRDKKRAAKKAKAAAVAEADEDAEEAPFILT